jgi:hypothetical protein
MTFAPRLLGLSADEIPLQILKGYESFLYLSLFDNLDFSVCTQNRLQCNVANLVEPFLSHIKSLKISQTVIFCLKLREQFTARLRKSG